MANTENILDNATTANGAPRPPNRIAGQGNDPRDTRGGNGTVKPGVTLREQQLQDALARFRALNPSRGNYASVFVDELLAFADRVGTSDVHMQPLAEGFEVRFRSDGVLQRLGEFPTDGSSSIVSRLKVLSNLLTYNSDIPQEGRLVGASNGREVRVSTYPTLHGERLVLRFFGAGVGFQRLDQLGHAPEVTAGIQDALCETSGALIVAGPAGSGKSTTLYACMRELAEASGGSRNLMTLEDPIEAPVAGVSQSQVNVPAGFDLPTGLRSLLRQDPEVIMVGEIRDAVTAETAIQAALTGQLMLTSFHSDSAAAAISRLLDMGIEPYLLRSGLIGVLCQRLLRRLCPCAEWTHDSGRFFGLPIESARVPTSCQDCNHTGYRGRVVTSEFLSLKDSTLADAVVDTKDSRATYRIALEHGMKSLWERSTELVREGVTSPDEVRRVLGVSMRI